MTIRRKPPMTAAEAHENVERIRRDTKPAVQAKLFHLALDRFGNLSDEARAVYIARLTELEG